MAGCTGLPKEHVSLIHMIQVFIREEERRKQELLQNSNCMYSYTHHSLFPDIESII